MKSFDPIPIPALNIGARWTSDEKNLIYIVSQRSTNNLWLQPLDVGPARQFTDFQNGSIYNFNFSPDGKKLYLARGFEEHDAVMLRGL